MGALINFGSCLYFNCFVALSAYTETSSSINKISDSPQDGEDTGHLANGSDLVPDHLLA